MHIIEIFTHWQYSVNAMILDSLYLESAEILSIQINSYNCEGTNIMLSKTMWQEKAVTCVENNRFGSHLYKIIWLGCSVIVGTQMLTQHNICWYLHILYLQRLMLFILVCDISAATNISIFSAQPFIVWFFSQVACLYSSNNLLTFNDLMFIINCWHFIHLIQGFHPHMGIVSNWHGNCIQLTWAFHPVNMGSLRKLQRFNSLQTFSTLVKSLGWFRIHSIFTLGNLMLVSNPFNQYLHSRTWFKFQRTLGGTVLLTGLRGGWGSWRIDGYSIWCLRSFFKVSWIAGLIW